MNARPLGRRALASAAGVGCFLAFSMFHLWQEWSLLRGYEPWAERHGSEPVRWLIEGAFTFALLAAPFVFWRDRARGEHLEEVTSFSRALGRLEPLLWVASTSAIVIHVVHVWLPKWTRGTSTEERWTLLIQSGTPFGLVVAALGLGAVHLTIAGALPRAWESLFGTPVDRRSRSNLRLVALTIAFVLWVLWLELTGFVLVGASTLWPFD